MEYWSTGVMGISNTPAFVVRKIHHRGAEYAEIRVWLLRLFRTLRTLSLCGEESFSLVAALVLRFSQSEPNTPLLHHSITPIDPIRSLT